MKEGLEAVSVILGIMGVVYATAKAIVRRIEKKAEEREAARQQAKMIGEKLLNLEANYGRLMEEREEFRKEIRDENLQLKRELEEVRRDFAQFIQQLFFKNK